jgi:hypothetical protein
VLEEAGYVKKDARKTKEKAGTVTLEKTNTESLQEIEY